jgi:hypothetical protein
MTLTVVPGTALAMPGNIGLPMAPEGSGNGGRPPGGRAVKPPLTARATSPKPSR